MVDYKIVEGVAQYTNPVQVVLTVSQATGKTYHAAYVTSQGGTAVTDGVLKIKHMQRLVFDGNSYTPSGGTAFTTTKLPEGTTYGYIEDNSATEKQKYDASAETYTATSATGTHTDDDATAHTLTVSYDGGVTNAIISVGDYTNHSDITNAWEYTPTGFLIDALPYILMIGIPLAAFIIWMIGRRRKLNR